MDAELTVPGCGQFSEVNNLCAECGSISSSKEHGPERYWRMPVKKSKKENKVGDSKESPSKEVLEQVKRNSDTDCNALMMRRAYNAGKSGNWESFKEEFREKGKLSEWTFERLQEAYDKVALEDIDRLSVAQDILRKSTDFL